MQLLPNDIVYKSATQVKLGKGLKLGAKKLLT